MCVCTTTGAGAEVVENRRKRYEGIHEDEHHMYQELSKQNLLHHGQLNPTANRT